MPRKKIYNAAEQFCSYLVKILDWTPSYSLHLKTNKVISEGPYWDHCSLDIQGEFMAPKKVVGGQVKVCFLASREMDEALSNPDDYKAKPKSLGGLSSRGENSDYLGSLPYSAFGHTLNMLQAGKYKYVAFHGKVLRYGKADIKSIYFMFDYEPDNYID
jgi:hypothetical protein